MLRRHFLHSAAAATLLGQTTPPDKTNVLLIVADDLGIGDLGCYGQKVIPTPNMDRLAAEGVRFTNAYAGAPVSGFSRCVLLTGKQPGYASVRNDGGGVPLEPTDVTVAKLLTEQGYRCGGFGIWGLGEVETTGHPRKQGFEKFFGYLHGQHAHQKYPGFLIDDEDYFAFNGNRIPEQTEYVQDTVAATAVSHMDSCRRKSKPFFAYFAPSLPSPELQAPFAATQPFEGKFPEAPYYKDPRDPWLKQNKPRLHYAGMLSKLDSYVGQCLDWLKEYKLEEQTLVILTSDGGSAAREWDPEDLFKSMGGLRGGRGSLYEGGLRVPLLVRWTGKIKPGSVLDVLASGQDLFPTILEATGIATKEEHLGTSLLPVLRATMVAAGKKGKPAKKAAPSTERDTLYWELPTWYKTSGRFAEETPQQAVRWGKWKGVRPQPGAAWEVYDLSKDPAEATNLALQQAAVIKRFDEIAASSRVAPRVQKQVPSLHFR